MTSSNHVKYTLKDAFKVLFCRWCRFKTSSNPSSFAKNSLDFKRDKAYLNCKTDLANILKSIKELKQVVVELEAFRVSIAQPASPPTIQAKQDPRPTDFSKNRAKKYVIRSKSCCLQTRRMFVIIIL